MWGERNVHNVLLASFPGFHARKHEHWSCAGVESLVFFLMWEAVKDRREVDATLIVRGHMRLRTEKGTKVADNLLHVSSYRALNIMQTERWSVVGWITRITLLFCFCPILITSCLRRKDTRLSTRCIFAFRESLGMRLMCFYQWLLRFLDQIVQTGGTSQLNEIISSMSMNETCCLLAKAFLHFTPSLASFSSSPMYHERSFHSYVRANLTIGLCTV